MNSGLTAARLVAYALADVPLPKEIEPIDHKALFEFSQKHSISALIGYALEKADLLPPAVSKVYLKQRKLALVKYATQEQELCKITAHLRAHNIKYMLLKGSVLKHLYPAPELRSMCDIDIQYDRAHLPQLKEIMLPLGYSLAEASGTDNANESYSKAPFMYIEFHGWLYDKNLPLYCDYFGNDFRRTVPVDGCEVKYSDEDFLVFLLAHFAKHYFLGGIGLRSLADVWLYFKKKALDLDYVFTQLKAIKLDEFTRIILKAANAVFEGEAAAGLEDVIDYCLHSGTYGTVERIATMNAVDESRLAYTLKRVFPKKEFMTQKYPIISKHPLLLAPMWAVRLAEVTFSGAFAKSDVAKVIGADKAQLDARKISGNPYKTKSG